jgi:Avidin family
MTKQERALSLAARGQPAAANFAGTWKNEYGSAMTLAVTGTMLSGIYTSEVSGANKKTQGTLTGYVNGDLIGLCVRWDRSASITAWVGHLVVENGTDAIETLWHMTTKTSGAEDPNQLWQSVFAGSDRFTR